MCVYTHTHCVGKEKKRKSLFQSSQNGLNNDQLLDDGRTIFKPFDSAPNTLSCYLLFEAV